MRIFLKFIFLLLLIGNADAAALPREVRDALQQAQIPLADVGIEVREVNARSALVSVNSRQPMNPASTMKLLTTYAGLELLGSAYTWKTEAYLDGKLEQGVLHGDLILKGYGDPKFTVEQFWLWLRELRGRGLREIRGDLVLDRSAFQLAPHDPAAFDNDPIRAYNVGPDALLLNFNAINLHLIPDGAKVSVLIQPELAGITLDNRMTLSAQGDCSNWSDAISPKLNSTTLLIQGAFPAACGEREQSVSLLPHPEYFQAVFRALWQELGGTLRGASREGNVTASAALFATHHSAPLSELIRDINKYSNNVMARQLYLSLGTSPAGPSTLAASEQVLRDWLAQKQLDFPELILENGAGLSRTERISARSMALLLRDAQLSSQQPEFEASLPIVGVDGTLKKRLHESASVGHAHLKSGTLEGAKTVAGYVQSRSGKQWVLVFFINSPNAAAGGKAQDALIEWVQQRH